MTVCVCSVAYGIYVISESLGSVIGNSAIGFFRDTTHGWDLDIEIFAGMAITATCLTLLLIFLDYMQWIGIGAHGYPMGGLNKSSFEAGKGYDRLKRHKDRYLAKEHRRWRDAERDKQEAHGEVVATLEPYNDKATRII
jgi:hypothetical protein